MAVHAAMVDRVDQGVGSIVQALKDAGQYENTVIFVLADNGASPERYLDPGFDRASETREGKPIQYAGRFEPGPETTWGYIGAYWANAREHAVSLLEGRGVRGGMPHAVDRPLAGRFEDGPRLDPRRNGARHRPVADVSGSGQRAVSRRIRRASPQAARRARAWRLCSHGKPIAGHPALFFEHEGGRAVQTADWKLVALAAASGSFTTSPRMPPRQPIFAAKEPDRVAELSRMWQEWAERVGVGR